MPQFRGGNPYFESENLYQSVSFANASMYHDTLHVIRIAIQFAKQIPILGNKIKITILRLSYVIVLDRYG